jgi:hypothetical protein
VLEKAEVKLAEPFGWTLEVRHTPDETYELPASLEWKPFHVRESKTEVKDGRDEKLTTFRFRLQPFDVGEQRTPAFRLLARSPSGVRQLEIPPQKVTVQGVIDPAQGEPKLREERRPLPRVYRRVWWPVAVPAAFGIGLLAWWLWRHRRRAEAARAPAKPRPPPFDEAMARIAALDHREQKIGISVALRRMQHIMDLFHRRTDAHRADMGRSFIGPQGELHGQTSSSSRRRRGRAKSSARSPVCS